jgi:hypothetical protein
MSAIALTTLLGCALSLTFQDESKLIPTNQSMIFIGHANKQYLLLLWSLVVHEETILRDVADLIGTVDVGFTVKYPEPHYNPSIPTYDLYDTHD